MSLKSLNSFNYFDLEAFLKEKRLVYIKADPWKESVNSGKENLQIGSKVVTQIIEDKTDYGREVDNFGEQLTVKVRGVEPEAYNKLRPLSTEVEIAEIEKAVIYGEFKNQLSITGAIKTKGGANT